MSSITDGEALQSLPAGHPQAGYTSEAHDGVQGTGLVPDSEQEWYDERVKAEEDNKKAVAKNEDEVAKKEAAEEEGSTPKSESKSASKSTSGSSSSS